MAKKKELLMRDILMKMEKFLSRRYTAFRTLLGMLAEIMFKSSL